MTDVRSTIIELRECLMSHEPDVRILGNVTCRDALDAIDTLMALAERYAVLRENGAGIPLVLAGVMISVDRPVSGTRLDLVLDRERARNKAPCPRGFWCVHDTLCEGARRI